MGCDKRYGLREVWVAPESAPNAPATFAATNYLYRCTGSTFPAVYREMLDNGEATGTRGQSTPFLGAQNDLSWDVTVMIPDAASMSDPTSLPESLQSLFWAAGFGGDVGPASWVPGEAGTVVMAIKAGSACGRTIQLLGMDRDKRQLELLTGAVVSQVVFTFSRSDVCTIQFSGVAAQKYEATAPAISASQLGNTTFSAKVASSYDMALPTFPQLAGVDLTLPGASAAVISIDGAGQTITLASDLSASTITARTQSYFAAPKNDALAYDMVSPDAWAVSSTVAAVQSATLTLETGQTYGELTTEAKYPTEILSGQAKVTANFTAYLVDANMALPYRSGDSFRIHLAPTAEYFEIANAILTEAPAIDLSSVDTAASGDFSLQGGETGSFASDGFLDTLVLNA